MCPEVPVLQFLAPTATMSVDADRASFNRAPASRPATWHKKDPSEWNFPQKSIMFLDILQDPPNSERPPVAAKTDPVPVYPVWRQHIWILPRLLPPIIIHRAFMQITGITFHPAFAFLFYASSFLMFGVSLFQMLRRMGKKYGFFDGAHPRDGVPDVHGWKVALSLLGVITIRPIFATFIAYDRTELPSITWKTPLDIIAYTLMLDMFFYIYHRSMHEVDFLWKLHRLHHTTKHPSANLGAYADAVQEWGDILIIPLLAYCIVPLNFTSWYLATGYLLYTEAAGHSGIRLYWQVPTTWFLRYFDMELCLEDHDRHHAVGYRTSGDYGKQSRLWDTLFYSKRQRVECQEENLDWVNAAVTQ